jgi:hypothetical protein
MAQTIGVALLTWPRIPARLDYFRRTVEGFQARAVASRHEFVYSVSAESDDVPSAEAAALAVYCNDHRIALTWREGKANLGANLNAALKLALAPDFILLLQDDWLLTETQDLSYYADFLDDNPAFALVRFGWPEVPAGDERARWIQKGGQVAGSSPHAPVIWLDPMSTYFYGDQPHLRRRSFATEFGWYKEGGDTGEPEVDLTDRLQRERWQIGLSDRVLFHHIGEHTSVRSDRERFR